MTAATASTPLIELQGLDELWFQVAGTLCNLECTHCFISCSPGNDKFGFLNLETVRRVLDESREWGVKEYYFTGGEPFLNRQMVDILCETLTYGPASVLTNGTVLKPEWLQRLRSAQDATCYGLEFRVSIDGPSAEMNDPVRGAGTFDRAMRGVGLLVEHGFLPIITMTRIWDESEELDVLDSFRRVLAEHGCNRPRLKVLPRLQIGAEAERTCGYDATDRVTTSMMQGYDTRQLICSHSRVVSDRGVHVCPILLDEPDALLGQTLMDADVAYPLKHGACLTCYQYGAICTNPTSQSRE